jgi:CubicO group peptidase (beta-lactamase class C family)
LRLDIGGMRTIAGPLARRGNVLLVVSGTAIVAVLLLMLVGCQTLGYQDSVKSADQILSNTTKLEADIRGKMVQYDLDAVSLAVVADCNTVYANSFSVEQDEPLQAASISKPVSAYAALKLVEQGKLALDTPLSSYLKERYFPDGSEGNSITLRMVLNHTCGLSNDTSGDDRRIYYPPGEAFHYSGAGFAYLTEVVEAVAGLPFDVFMEQSVLVPLGMTHSKFSIPLTGGGKAVSAAYSLVTTPADLALFFTELLQPRMISEDLIEQMLSDSVKINEHYSWGLGVGLQHGGGDTAIWQWGDNADYHKALAIFFLNSRTGIVVMASGKNGDKVFQDIAHDAIGGAYYGLQRGI